MTTDGHTPGKDRQDSGALETRGGGQGAPALLHMYEPSLIHDCLACGATINYLRDGACPACGEKPRYVPYKG